MIEAVGEGMVNMEFPMFFEGKSMERDFIFEVSKGAAGVWPGCIVT
jgi:hypothetical protein